MTIVEHKATTYPTFDPTWYSPISIVLAAVEVDMAIVCASVPVFWPALREGWGKIFVTKEVEVSHADRRDSTEGMELRSSRSSELHFAQFTDEVVWGRTKTTVKSETATTTTSHWQERRHLAVS